MVTTYSYLYLFTFYPHNSSFVPVFGSQCLVSLAGLGTAVDPGHPAPEDTGPGHQENAALTPGLRHGSTRKRADTS